mgnify:CR=1 FL=1|tara:strand:- start:3563 stop:3958 length:396 start_codon:yes stop_codon:yes gene_type:complete
MATNATWTIIFDDKKIIKNTGAEAGTTYAIADDAFWSQSKFSNIWAIQYGNAKVEDQVEHRDSTPHTAYDASVHGDFQAIIDKWDTAHLAQLQSDWDNDNLVNEEDGTPTETAEQKINRLGARPTSYSSEH